MLLLFHSFLCGPISIKVTHSSSSIHSSSASAKTLSAARLTWADPQRPISRGRVCLYSSMSLFHHEISKFAFPVRSSNHGNIFGGCSRTWTAGWGKYTLLSRNKIDSNVWDSLGWFPFQPPRPHSWSRPSRAARMPDSHRVGLQHHPPGVVLLHKAELTCLPLASAPQWSSGTNSRPCLW